MKLNDGQLLCRAKRLFELAVMAIFPESESEGALLPNLIQGGLDKETGETVWGLADSGSDNAQAGGGAKWELERDLGDGLVLRVSGHVPQSALKAVAESMEKTSI